MNAIETLYNEWQSLQPLKPEDQKRLNQKFMLEFNYNSNHIEGNTLSYGQTKLLLMFGETSGDAKLRDYEEMKAHNVGLEMVKREALDKERPLSEAFIRELNRTILVENFWKSAKTPTGEPTRMEVQVGVYKTRPNSVITATGEMFDYASPEETSALMTELVTWYNEEEVKGELCPIQLATLLHYRYIRIHPFEDGNGRIARLLVNYVLMRHGYPMIIVQSRDKENYLNVLHKCDIEVGLNPSDGANAQIEQVEPFLEYMEKSAKHALETSIKAAKGENIEEESDLDKRIVLLQRKAKSKFDKDHISQAEEIIKQSITPLLLQWDMMLSKFDRLFEKRVDAIYLDFLNNTSRDDFKNIKELIDSSIYQSIWKELSIDADYSGLKSSQITIDCSAPALTIRLTSTVYEVSINIEEQLTIKKEYDEFLNEEDISRIVQQGSELFIAYIEEEINNL